MADLSEKEQLDAMRAWWSENWTYVVGGIVVGIVIIGGIRGYRATTANAEIAASTIYEDVMYAAGTDNLDEAERAASTLFAEHDASSYAALARLAMARMYMDNARDQDAVEVLSALVESQPDSEIALVARLRLAKILLYQGKADEVIDLVRDQPESAFAARMNEVLGDAYVAKERYADAQAAYVLALNDNPRAPTVDTSLIQLKMNDLPPVSDQEDSTGNETPDSDAVTDEPSVDDPVADELPADDSGLEPPAEGESGTQ